MPAATGQVVTNEIVYSLLMHYERFVLSFFVSLSLSFCCSVEMHKALEIKLRVSEKHSKSA